MILMLAPGPNMAFGAMPSGVAYASDQFAIIKVANDSTADQTALAGAGCFTLSPFGNWGTFQFTLLSDLYAADAASNLVLPGVVGFPRFTAATIANDSGNTGTWRKTGTGAGSGNWTQTSTQTLDSATAAVAASATAAAASATAAATSAAAVPALIAAIPISVGTKMRFFNGKLVQEAAVYVPNLSFGKIVTSDAALGGAPNLMGSVVGVSNGLAVSQAADGSIRVSLGTIEGHTPIGLTSGAYFDTTKMRFFGGKAVVMANRDLNMLSSEWTTADGTTNFLTLGSAANPAEYAEGAAGYQYSTASDGLTQQLYETNTATGIAKKITSAGPVAKLQRGGSGAFIEYQVAGQGRFQISPTDGVEHLIFPKSDLFIGGDSLMKPGGTGLGAALAGLYPQRVSTNQASATQFSMHMAARLGATTINGVTFKYAVSGGSIPTSGGVTVTPDSTASIVVDLFFSWNFTQGSFNCVLGGVPGVISYDSGTGLQTFTRTNSGTAVSAASPVALQVTSGFATNLTAAGAPSFPDLHEQTSPLLIGYNDVRAGTVESATSGVTGYSAFNLTNTMGNIAQIDALLSSRVKRRIWGLMPQSALCLTDLQCAAIDTAVGGAGAGFGTLGVAANDAATIAFLTDAAALRAALVSTYPFTADFMAAFKLAGHTVSWGATQGLGQNWDFIRPDFNSAGTDGTHWTTTAAQALAASVFSTIINANGW